VPGTRAEAGRGGTGSRTTTFVAVGDIHPCKEERPEALFDHVADLIRGADIGFGQVEVLFSDIGELQRFPSATPYIHVPPDYAAALPKVGLDVVSCASNHALDWGPAAFLDSIANMRACGLAVAGGGTDERTAREPAVLDRGGNTVALLAYTSVAPPGCYATDTRPGVAPMRARTYYETMDYQAGTPPRVVTVAEAGDLAAMQSDIAAAKQSADVVVVSLHWGVHHIPKVIADYQPVVAHAAVDAGADLVVGHHPHLLKAVEVYRGVVIFYSIGNFAFDGTRHRTIPDAARHERLRHYQQLRSFGDRSESQTKDGPPPRHPPDARKTVIVRATISDGAVSRVTFQPTLINDMSQPVPLESTTEDFDDVLGYMDWVSDDFSHCFVVDGDEVVVLPVEIVHSVNA
jgi:poly-gamma-glutamate synthesis protein (capsule biosynthesis protein)